MFLKGGKFNSEIASIKEKDSIIKSSFDNLETLFKNASELKELTGFMKKNIDTFEESKEKSQNK